jgi:hypothetical protein
VTPPIRTRPNGQKYPLSGKGKGGAGLAVAAAAVAVLGLGGGAAGLGGLGGTGGASASSIAGNLADDVADSLPGRDLKTRKAEGRKSAQRGRSDEAWSRMKFKELRRKVEHRLECLASSTGQVRTFLTRTPCTSLQGILLAVGDGRGNAAVVSVVRIGFRTGAQADAFQKVEDVGGSGDIRPWNVAAFLNLADAHLTANHYHLRDDKTAKVIAEADTVSGHIDNDVLDALADIASYLPVT